MKPGDVVLTRMPAEAGRTGRLRPALVIVVLPGVRPALLVCGISSRVDRSQADWDLALDEDHPDFRSSGLKAPSVVRPSWLVSIPVTPELPLLGQLGLPTLSVVRERLAAQLLT